MENIKRVNLCVRNVQLMNRITWLLACFFTITVSAQEKLFIRGSALDMYVVYPSNGSESLQSISNGFGLSVSKLSSYNNTNINPAAVLAKGTEVKIPFTKDILLKQPGENSGPVFHLIKKGDNLYHLSQLYNKVPIASLREWNHLKNDVVKDGQQLIVGYMVNAKTAIEKPAEKKPEAKKDAVVMNNVPAPEKKPEVKKDIPVTNNSVIIEDKDRKLFPDKLPPAPSSISKTQPTIIVPVVKDNKVTEPKQPVTEPKKKDEPPTEYSPKEGDEGFFATSYAEHAKEQTQQFHSGDAATFKTISGWTDRKFYVLMNDVAPRTVVRITGPTNKSICAMVLGPLQETKGASGLLLRLSNSAASALGIIDPKFTVTVTYFE